MDVYEIGYKLRHNSLSKETTISAVALYAMRGEQEKAIEAGADGYLEKPINPEAFVNELEYYINRK